MKYLSLLIFLLSLHVFANGEGGKLERILYSEKNNEIYIHRASRTMYVLDAKDLSVKKRIWLGYNILGMHFAPDGKNIILECDNSSRLVDTVNFKEIKNNNPLKNIDVSMTKKLISGITYDGIEILDSSFKRVKLIKLSKDDRPRAVCFNEKGDRLLVLTDSTKGKEKKLTRDQFSKASKDMSYSEKKLYEHKVDGKVNFVYSFDVRTGKKLGRAEVWLIGSNRTGGFYSYLKIYKNKIAIFNPDQHHSVINKGKIQIIESPNNASGYDMFDKFAYIGSYEAARRFDFTTMEFKDLKFEALGSFESFTDFYPAKDGSVFE